MNRVIARAAGSVCPAQYTKCYVDGKWLECRARLVIKGGNPPPPTASGWVFDVILRGYGGDIV